MTSASPDAGVVFPALTTENAARPRPRRDLRRCSRLAVRPAAGRAAPRPGAPAPRRIALWAASASGPRPPLAQP